MNTDIRIKTNFLTHHKTLRLLRKIGAEGVLSLIGLWLYVAQYRPKGDISDLSPEDIAAVSLWNKDPQIFLNVLIEVGFIDETINPDGSIKRVIHDWEEHNKFCYFAPERSEIARKNVEKRWKKKVEKSESYTNRITNCNTDCNTPIPIPIPNPNTKEKEYINNKSCIEEKDNYTQLSKESFVSSNTVNFDENSSSFKGIEKYLQKWKEAFPLVDVDGEIRQMEAWIASVPKTRWKKDWKRFIVNWLSREQDRAEIRSAKQKTKKIEWEEYFKEAL